VGPIPAARQEAEAKKPTNRDELIALDSTTQWVRSEVSEEAVFMIIEMINSINHRVAVEVLRESLGGTKLGQLICVFVAIDAEVAREPVESSVGSQRLKSLKFTDDVVDKMNIGVGSVIPHQEVVAVLAIREDMKIGRTRQVAIGDQRQQAIDTGPNGEELRLIVCTASEGKRVSTNRSTTPKDRHPAPRATAITIVAAVREAKNIARGGRSNKRLHLLSHSPSLRGGSFGLVRARAGLNHPRVREAFEMDSSLNIEGAHQHSMQTDCVTVVSLQDLFANLEDNTLEQDKKV
jgi:hypothetical protein